MKLLLIHPNFPAQFYNLATVLGQLPGHEVVFLTASTEYSIPGVQKVLFEVKQRSSGEAHFCTRSTEEAFFQGLTTYEAAVKLKRQGFYPDIIIGHSGWGGSMFMKDIYPNAIFVGYFEWFNHAIGTSHDFNPNHIQDINQKNAIRVANAPILIDLYSCDAGITPTLWQQKQFPLEYRSKIEVIHEGIRTETYAPSPGSKLVIPEIGLDLSSVNEIITYVSRGLEPYRGFPQFMHAIEKVLRQRPSCHVVIVAADRVAYGEGNLPEGLTYKQKLLSELDLDLSRVHFTGLLPRNQYLKVLQASSVHVYLTYPFVLSWSVLEAMSAGCLVVASKTPPVQEVIQSEFNGLLVDFFSSDELANQICEVLASPAKYQYVRENARETILDKYSWRKTVPHCISYLESFLR